MKIFNRCQNCGRLVFHDTRDKLGIFCSMVCRNNVAYPGFCDACVAASWPFAAGDSIRINGIGTAFYGTSDACKTCGSVVRRQFFCIFFIPLFPMGKFRVKYVSPNRYLSRRAFPEKAKAPPTAEAPKDWRTIAENLGKAGWTWGCTSRVDSNGKTIFVADATRGDGKRFIVRADDELTAFLELERQIHTESATASVSPLPAPEVTSPTLPEISSSHSNAPKNRRVVFATVLAALVTITLISVAIFSTRELPNNIATPHIDSQPSLDAPPSLRLFRRSPRILQAVIW
jgi:hypothetical protein